MRFVLDAEARRQVIHGFRLTFEEFKARPKLELEDWIELQLVYRLAEAFAEPKRGKRPHVNRGYEWYFDAELETPMIQLEKWEMALSTGKRLKAGTSVRSAATPS